MGLLKLAVRRIFRILKGKYGKKNHFAHGVFIYENASVGNYNYFAPYSLFNNVKIGNYCSFGPGCKVGLSEHATDTISTYTKVADGKGHMKVFYTDAPVIIENDVWLGSGVFVRQGVRIGNGAVVGAHSTVLQDIPPYAVAVGTPAKVIRYRFDGEKISAILKSGWFEKDLQEAKTTVQNLK